MTTDLTTYQPPTAADVVTYQDRAVQRLADWAHSAEAAHSIATTLVQTSFCPDSFRGKAGEATAAILAGLEVGLQPMAALRSFDVIQGQAAPRAITLRAIVQSFGHEIVMEESTATRCKMRGKRRGSSEWVTVTWTIDRARDLRLTGKQNWQQQPQAMLIARATSELCRLIAADAILGLGYAAEEVADGATADVPVATAPAPEPTATGRRTLSRPRPATPDAEATADVVVDAETVDPEPLTDKTRKQLFAELTKHGITDAARQRAGMSAILGRPVKSRTELTEADAQTVIADLKARPTAEPAAPAGDPTAEAWGLAEPEDGEPR